jgi:hypothetical protein
MKYLNKLVLTGMLTLLPLISISPNTYKQYIPIENKLRQIEKDSDGTSLSGCMHKSMRYYINAKEAGEEAYLIVGWRTPSEVWHAWVGIRKNRTMYYVDPGYNDPNIDGFPKFRYLDRERIYVFDKNTTIEEFANFKHIKKRNKQVIKKYYKKVKTKGTYTKESMVNMEKSIENYCKQDTSAWNYYQKYIAKNKR